MRNPTKIFMIVAMIAAMGASAQSIPRQVLSEGGNTTIAGGVMLCWTLGQPGPVSMATAPSVIVTQGFQQSEEAELGVNPAPVVKSGFKIYPNPSQGLFHLEGSRSSPGRLNFQILNCLGNLILEGSVIIPVTGKFLFSVNLSDHPEGIYFLRMENTGDPLSGSSSYKLCRVR